MMPKNFFIVFFIFVGIALIVWFIVTEQYKPPVENPPFETTEKVTEESGQTGDPNAGPLYHISENGDITALDGKGKKLQEAYPDKIVRSDGRDTYIITPIE